MVAKWTLNYLCALSIRPLFSLLWVLGHMQSWGVHLIVFWQYIRGKATMVGRAMQLQYVVLTPNIILIRDSDGPSISLSASMQGPSLICIFNCLSCVEINKSNTPLQKKINIFLWLYNQLNEEDRCDI